jgi:IS5 family transposase
VASHLSDEQTEYLIRDRISFMRFLDLELDDSVRMPSRSGRFVRRWRGPACGLQWIACL